MKKAELKVYKEQLLALRARLRGDVSAMADAALRKTRIGSQWRFVEHADPHGRYR